MKPSTMQDQARQDRCDGLSCARTERVFFRQDHNNMYAAYSRFEEGHVVMSKYRRESHVCVERTGPAPAKLG